MCYTKIPKNTGILFSKIPVSVFESNPGIPVFSGIPQGPDCGTCGTLLCRILAHFFNVSKCQTFIFIIYISPKNTLKKNYCEEEEMFLGQLAYIQNQL